MRTVLIIVLSALSVSCIEPILFTNCALESPFKKIGKKRFFVAQMSVTGESVTQSHSPVIECEIVDYVCNAGEMGLDEVWETKPDSSYTLEGKVSDSSVFKIDTPGCQGLIYSNNSYLKGKENFSYWANPRIEENGKTTSVPIWYPKHRANFYKLGIVNLELSIIEVEG